MVGYRSPPLTCQRTSSREKKGEWKEAAQGHDSRLIEYALTLESLGLEKTEFEQAMSYVKEKQAACSVLVAPGFHSLR
jgi:Holliday junction resolvasome RuvABC DNA-binding subunit